MIKKIIKKCTPPIIIENLKRLNTERQLLLNRALLAKNKRISGSFAGQECFILATGPSIKKQNLEKLRGRNCISVSNFFVHPEFNTIKPIFHCIAPYHLPITEDAWQGWMLDLRNHMSPETAVVFGLSDFKRNEECFKNIKHFYLSFSASESYISKKGIQLEKALLPPQSVSIQALQLALGLGFSRIFLLGCDHDYFLNYGESAHFYEEKKDAKVRGGYSEWDKSLVEDIGLLFESMANLWRQYRLLRDVAHKQSVEILNLTEGGCLDVFQRASFLEYV
jgi:hypothetical protein